MEYQAGQENDFSDVVETLTSMFGNVLSKDVILAIVESCDGDLNLAAEAIISMSSDTIDDSMKPVEEQSEVKHDTAPDLVSTEERRLNIPSTSNQNTSSNIKINQPGMSYAGISSSTGAVPKQSLKLRPPPSNVMVWTDQLRKIISQHNQGARLLLIMRGLPGSGKTYLAKQIIELTIGATFADYRNHICSTDDFFMIRGQYQYDKYRLSEAHDWNQNRVRQALRQGLSPIIVDNTNIEIWEMEPYLREGVKNGYYIHVVEPNTPWAKKIGQLMKKNSHNVPAATIKRKLENYQDGITGNILIRHYGLSYPAHMVPPVIRNIPEYIPPQVNFEPRSLTNAQTDVVERGASNWQRQEQPQEEEERSEGEPQTSEGVVLRAEAAAYIPTERIIPIEIESKGEELARNQRYWEIEKQLKEMEKVEQEWEKNEGWDESEKTNSSSNEVSSSLEPRPQRRTTSEGSSQSTPRDLLESVQNCDDWRKISMFMPSWTDESSVQIDECIEAPVREKTSTETCIQAGDTNINIPGKKIMIATPRDINFLNISLEPEKIPTVRMLDKSSMTNELLITEAYRCKNEEQHFKAFRKLFRNIPRASLKDIFDKCCGDVNWAVDIVLGGMAANQLQIVEDDVSDTEEDATPTEQCNCLAAYQIVPDTESKTITVSNITANQQYIPTTSNQFNLPQKKVKISPSDTNLHFKREIEKNIVISDNHYSPHTLKIRKFRRGEDAIEPLPSTSKEDIEEDTQQTKELAEAQSDDEESNTSSLDDVERTVNVNVGFEFIGQLDKLFGRQGMVYPENIQPRINIPVSLLNEINAFWMESLMWQLEESEKENDRMLREDAEFARQLEIKEAELAQQGKEPEVPDFKEIMDMDFAISLYQKDVAEWKSKEPKDLAAKLSRDKLYNLFPDMNPDVLSELLMAHDNNFQATVEVLLMSTGNANILEEKNGLNKFVMEKEMERQEKLLEEEKKALSEVEWPLLPKGEAVDMTVVNNYREEADKHLARRTLNYHKAQDYIRRGMTQVANYYSDIASFHKQKYEQANSLAAASLIQVHASKSPDNATIDLHYLRVGEAKESLDLFLDSHIQKLKECSHKSVKSHTLFFITGRGLHSQGGPRVKPAVKKRLRERGLAFSERNPGLLTAKVTAEDKLSYQVNLP